MKDLSYQERLKIINLPTLEARRTRGAFITLYKCTTGMMETDIQNFIPFSGRSTRGTNKKIQLKRGAKDVRKHFFPINITEKWNGLPDHIVNAKNINQLKKTIR